MNIQQKYSEASIKTASNLRSVAYTVSNLSQLSLPEIDAVTDIIARLVPAGNVPGVILNGLARLPNRRLPENIIKRDINLLFKGVEAALDRAVYGAFFAGPAAVIWGYQNLLKLAGKDPQQSFPEGLWQFYVEYALREDTARHANETRGFDQLLTQHNINLNPVDRITAWLMAAIHILHQYPNLLANEWRERVYLAELQRITSDNPQNAALYPIWEKQRPYGRGHDSKPHHSFATYRKQKFNQFLTDAISQLSSDVYQTWKKQLHNQQQNLQNYVQQLSIWSYLEPSPYGEARKPLTLESLCVGLIYKRRYYLLPVCEKADAKPRNITSIRQQVSSIISLPTGTASVHLSDLATIKRAHLAHLRRNFNAKLNNSLKQLQHAPILFNADQRPAHLPLTTIRQAERGIGDHALTLFDTGQSIVFDQSHIYFDGAWGAALAEIFTKEAMSWAIYLNQLPAPKTNNVTIQPLAFPLDSAEKRLIEQAPHITTEASVESSSVNLQLLLTTRKLLKQRNNTLALTVNDWLILYRAIHAVSYQPNPEHTVEINRLAQTGRNRKIAQAIQASLDNNNHLTNPAILIPVDASRFNPKDRLYPMVFEAPLQDLDLLSMHHRTLDALNSYNRENQNFEAFYELQRTYLAALAGFGQVLKRVKEIGLRGESVSTGSIKLLAHMPVPVQRLLDAVPNRFDLLNDLIKGREVFSNVGRVVQGSTLSRFSTAKDDNEKKTLTWGVLTDNRGVMCITLRDFRPHVASLSAIGYKSLATQMTQHYLDSYVTGLNAYTHELRRIVMASH